MDDTVTRLALRSQEPKIILHGSDDGGLCGEEYVVELQETVLLSDGENDGENDGVAVRSFSSDELVIQDAVEDVVAEDDEGVTVETCVMSLEGEEDEEDGVTVAEEELVEERENELHSSGDYLMISLDEDGKMVSADGEEVTVEGALDDQEVEKDEDGQEVIKVYIFKADSGDDELGEGDSDSVCKPLREKMLYMSVSDGHHAHTDGQALSNTHHTFSNTHHASHTTPGGSKLSDEVYMEVVVGGEEPVCNDRTYESKDFMPVNWTAAYDDSECCENRNGAASAVLHIDESEMPHTLKPQHGKTHRRAEHRQVQTAIIIGPYGQPLTVYPCVLCGKKFKSRGFLKRHTRNHHQDILSRKKYQCTDCDFTTNKKSSFHSHMEEHTQHMQHTLSTKAQFESETPKDFHQQVPLFSSRLHPQQKTKMATVPAKKTHKCKFCEYETAEQGLLNRHLLAVHSKNFPHVCVECGKGFRHPSELRKHTRTHTGEKPYSCTHCSYRSADSSNLKTHMKTKHSREDEDEETTVAVVPHTEQLTENIPDVTQDHDPDHDRDNDDTGEAQGHRCDLCDHRSSNSSDLKRHVISVHTKDYPHKCDACGKGFHRPSELKKHAASHKAKRPHQCRHCSFKTADPFVLSRHILSVHTKEQQQQETQQNANEQQQQPAPSLQMQERSPPKKTIGAAQLALGGAPIIKKVIGAKGPRERRVYQCQYCDYSTGDASGFKRHVISIHTKDYPHRCQFCSKGFRRPSEKNQHIMRHHKDMMPSE